jgi:hypothetical protein
MLMRVGGEPTTRGPQGVNPPRDRAALREVQRKQREERSQRLSHVVTKTHMQAENHQPKVKKTTTKTTLVPADGTH